MDLQTVNVHLSEDTDGIHCRLMYLEPSVKYVALAAFPLTRMPFLFQLWVDPPELARLTELADHDWFRDKVTMVLRFRVDQAITSGELRLKDVAVKAWFTVKVEHADEPEMNHEETAEGVPAGYGYLSTLLEAPDFVRLEFLTGLVRTTIIRME